MNIRSRFIELGIDSARLTEKKQQTNKKIELVRDYVVRWAEISAVRQDIQVITFIDCMSNAGAYKDGDCCTSIEVLQVFCQLAVRYPHKHFRVMCNDNDAEKIAILEKVAANIVDCPANVQVNTSSLDVNEYLAHLSKNPIIGNYNVFGYGCSTILYVDPYNFGTVEIPAISSILEKYYCELIFNFFTSDFTRNIKRDSGRIQKCLGGEAITTLPGLFEYMRKMLRVGRIRYLFSYEFHIANNVELYQIVFATPNKLGLEKLKETLWKVFNGAEYHRNRKDLEQTSLFSDDYDQRLFLDNYAREAQSLLVQYFNGQQLSFSEIEEFLIEYTMLGGTHIIDYVLKPMIASGQVIKRGMVGSRNYKKDCYMIAVETSK